ncbi:MAG: SBBP repeat-containing protein [Bryobacterales bacterium]|nr:SBBP repeat-containing protein [Bryobacteraceae bacterium]MDW8354309.1 SBBP repeat-containing protein [Bryobacterales bacterium]
MRRRFVTLICAALLCSSGALAANPAILFAGYFGGDRFDQPAAIARDPDGGIWVASVTTSFVELPVQPDPFQFTVKGARDVSLAKYVLEPSGRLTLVYWTALGGAADDLPAALAVDASGNVYVAGMTASTNFPTAGNAHQTSSGGGWDAFVAKINPRLSGAESLVYSTYIGGPGLDAATALALDPVAGLVVVGYTGSGDLSGLPSGTLQPGNRGGWDAFIARLDPDRSPSLLFLSFLGGNSTDAATGVAFDGASLRAWVAGYTLSTDFPIAGVGAQAQPSGGGDGFLVEVDFNRSGLETLTYGTYFGGSGLDVPRALARDTRGGFWLTGYTLSDDFPLAGPSLQRALGGNADVFVARLDPSRPASEFFTYSTYLGGASADVAYALARLDDGRVALAGYTTSSDFPLRDAAPANTVRFPGADAFMAVLDPAAPEPHGLTWSALLAGAGTETATGLVSAPGASFYVTGYTTSRNLPVTDGSTKPTPPGAAAGFLAQVGPAR